MEEGTADKDFACHGTQSDPGEESSTSISDFCKELKTEVEGDVPSGCGVKSVQVITSFDTAILCKVTSLSSSGRIPALCGFNAISKHVFRVGEY